MQEVIIVIALIVGLFIYSSSQNRDNNPEGSLYDELVEQYKGCPEFDGLSEKERQSRLSYQTPKKICEDLFFETYKIGSAEMFLGPIGHKKYQIFLNDRDCLKAEQILWHHYKRTYPKAPNIKFSDEFSPKRQFWRLTVLAPQAPEIIFCMAKQEIETSQKLIRLKAIQTQPISDLRKISSIKNEHEVESERNYGLMRMVHLMMRDYPPAQIFLINESIKGEIYRLRADQHYRLLKRLIIIGQLPGTLEKEYQVAKQKLDSDTIKKIDQDLTKYSFFFVQTMPTTADKKNY